MKRFKSFTLPEVIVSSVLLVCLLIGGGFLLQQLARSRFFGNTLSLEQKLNRTHYFVLNGRISVPDTFELDGITVTTQPLGCDSLLIRVSDPAGRNLSRILILNEYERSLIPESSRL